MLGDIRRSARRGGQVRSGDIGDNFLHHRFSTRHRERGRSDEDRGCAPNSLNLVQIFHLDTAQVDRLALDPLGAICQS